MAWKRHACLPPAIDHSLGRFEASHLVNDHTVGCDPSIKSQLASHNQLEGLLWCYLVMAGHLSIHGGGCCSLFPRKRKAENSETMEALGFRYYSRYSRLALKSILWVRVNNLRLSKIFIPSWLGSGIAGGEIRAKVEQTWHI